MRSHVCALNGDRLPNQKRYDSLTCDHLLNWRQ